MLRFCSPTMVRVEYAFEGAFIDTYPTPAVVDDRLQPMEIDIHEDGTCYEVFTGAVRVCIDKNPFAIRMYDAYQRMLAADVPGGYRKEGGRIICTKRMDRRESFFGLRIRVYGYPDQQRQGTGDDAPSQGCRCRNR